MPASSAPPRAPAVVEARFVAEARDPAALPPAGPPEIAIAGRSNVGKSTLLNRLAGRRGLARTSRTPGRTRGLVFFDVVVGAPDRRVLRLVDLPGYGFARVGREERRAWRPLVEGYVRSRPTLALFIALADARRGLEEEERQLLEWLDSIGTPRRLVLTKIDKIGAAERGRLLQSRPDALAVSGETGEGVGALWAAILAAVETAARSPAPDGR
jgi:GTP-binding protein